ncbi:MAG: hypothetical protein L0Z53_21670, partial [Acidobacteriales bacterium]|nr:hypothetical protein [Terriglobales bacterium]
MGYAGVATFNGTPGIPMVRTHRNSDAIGFVDIRQSARKHFDKLWRLASKWPAADIEGGIRYWVYEHVGASDKLKAEVYRACKEPALR